MKALIAMSGGVDSSVAALKTIENGYDCYGVTMRLQPQCDFQKCGSEQDIKDAAAVCDRLGITHTALDCSMHFEDKVIRYFIDTYKNGGTPNPCIMCNKHMKFAGLLDYADSQGIDKIVTGHYARITQDPSSGRFNLCKAADSNKDQSYVLYTLTQEQLGRTLFPLGSYTKDEIRAIASENGFVNAAKKESQDICFVPDGDYASFIEKYTGIKDKPGDYVNTDGKVLGQHKGITHYTVGQRKGLNIAYGSPLFVIGIDVNKNQVILSHGDGLFKKTIYINEVNLISCDTIDKPIRCAAKIRYRHQEQPCTAVQVDSDTIRLDFDEPQRAPTLGQAAVLYDGDIVIGGGTICRI